LINDWQALINRIVENARQTAPALWQMKKMAD
jgi:hypothetical protein